MQPTPTRSPTRELGRPRHRLLDGARDLVARHERERRLAPLLACGMDVGVADAGERDLDQDVARAEVAALDGGLLKGGLGGRCRVCGDRSM